MYSMFKPNKYKVIMYNLGIVYHIIKYKVTKKNLLYKQLKVR